MRYILIVSAKRVGHPYDNDQFRECGGRIREKFEKRDEALNAFLTEVHLLDNGYVGVWDGYRKIGEVTL